MAFKTEEQREHWRAYTREYRHTHPDKVREWRERYYIRKAAQLNARGCKHDAD